MRKATEFNKELVTSENRYKASVREFEKKNKILREEIAHEKAVNSGLLDTIEEMRTEKKPDPKAIASLKRELVSAHEDIVKKVSIVRDFQCRLVKSQESHQALFEKVKTEMTSLGFSTKDAVPFDPQASFDFIRSPLRSLQEEVKACNSQQGEADKVSLWRSHLEETCAKMEDLTKTSRTGLGELESLWNPCLSIPQ